MLDLFSIISRGGIVLWYFQRAADIHVSLPVNSLIKSVILQERSGAHIYEAHKLYFKLDNEFELIFVVGYQKMLQLSYIDKLLDQVMLEFRSQYKSQLLHNKLINKFEFTNHFQDILKQCEDEVRITQEAPRKMMTFEQSSKSKKTVESLKKAEAKDVPKTKPKKTPTPKQPVMMPDVLEEKPDMNHNVIANGTSPADDLTEDMIKRNLENLRNRKNKANAPAVKGKENGKTKPKGKESRVWPYGGNKGAEKDLDYSKPRSAANGDDGHLYNGYHGDANGDDTGTTNSALVEVGSMRGQLKDLDTRVDEADIDYSEDSEEEESGSDIINGTGGAAPGGGDVKRSNSTGQSMKILGGGLFGVFKGLVGSKTLTPETLEGPLEKMREHLIGKNVASEVADELCNSVSLKLQGKTVGSFSTIASSVRSAMEESLTTILSPKQRIDMLRDAQARARGPNARPYVVTFCGVNGVGKSTNLAKICFWLIENGLRVLIAGCDTFRAGAVEQLKTHCRALNALHPPNSKGVMVQLYEKGYGKDAAAIAQEAINFAKSTKFDVVLVDTAGRMQDNEPLMRALAKLISVNNPDLVLFVGEALVGNEATDQLLKFNRALADHAPVGVSNGARTIDAIVLTKFDTIDDKVGACVSMTHSTGQPILFVGTGQTYTDLKVLNVTAVVNALLRN